MCFARGFPENFQYFWVCTSFSRKQYQILPFHGKNKSLKICINIYQTLHLCVCILARIPFLKFYEKFSSKFVYFPISFPFLTRRELNFPFNVNLVFGYKRLLLHNSNMRKRSYIRLIDYISFTK